MMLVLCTLFVTVCLNAQSKVFKEVNDDISTDMKVITQDGALVGYLVFSQLEAISEDSFNYKIAILDENLNDLGTVNFKDEKLGLQAVSFEQDVLCLAYLKSNIIGKTFKNNKSYKKALGDQKTSVVVQFLNLDGKIINTHNIPVKNDVEPIRGYETNGNKIMAVGALKHGIQLKNISNKGFVCFYGDKFANYLLTYAPDGKMIWKKNVPDAKSYGLITADDDIYLLWRETSKFYEGGYSVSGYGLSDSSNFLNYLLKDKNNYDLKVLGVGNDPTTNKLYISGNIISKKKGNSFTTGKELTKGPYVGVFNISFNGRKKTDINEVFTYWSDGSQAPSISTRGRFLENNSYVFMHNSIRDFQGNTYFLGTGFIKRMKWGSVASSVILSPLVVPTIMIAAVGYQKFKVTDAIIVKQSPKGLLSIDNTIESNHSKFIPWRAPFSMRDDKSFYLVNNTNTKTNYIIVDDVKDIFVYNLNQHKIIRTIPHKDGNVRTNIYPAKEGHVMVAEYNKKEKFTRFSIESL